MVVAKSENTNEKCASSSGFATFYDYYHYSESFLQSILIIASVVFLLDKIFDILSEKTIETPFNELIKVIEKELMIVGFTAFVFKIVLGSKTKGLDSEMIHGLEFAGIFYDDYIFFLQFQKKNIRVCL